MSLREILNAMWLFGKGGSGAAYFAGSASLNSQQMVTGCNFPTAQGRELRALRTLKREAKSVFIFVSERGASFHRH
jgi:hypothetical protein